MVQARRRRIATYILTVVVMAACAMAVAVAQGADDVSTLNRQVVQLYPAAHVVLRSPAQAKSH
jgi:outer membrane murein-binding lipoprotein Lpp